MKLSARRTRMLHNLGLTWLQLPEAAAANGSAAPTPLNATDAASAHRVTPQPTASSVPAQIPRSIENPVSQTNFGQNTDSVDVFSESVATFSAAVSNPPAQTDLDALSRAVASCQACGLCKTRRNTVFGEGAQAPRVLVLGDAPGEGDDAQGRPFVGQAGQLLDQMLKALNLSRETPGEGSTAGPEQVFITNTLKCRPPSDRNPVPAELAACDGFLQRQIQLLRPQVIFALGKSAIAQSLRDPALSSQPLGKLRAQVHAVQIAGVDAKVIVSYHPSYLLRSPAEKARAWEDLVLLADTLENLPAKTR